MFKYYILVTLLVKKGFRPTQHNKIIINIIIVDEYAIRRKR